MLILLSPAKKLSCHGIDGRFPITEPMFGEEAEYLSSKLKKKGVRALKEMMGISEHLAQLNQERYQHWQMPHPKNESTQAALMFQGDVYQGLQADGFSNDEMDYAQAHIRILSGLYGLLRPLDQVMPYRLEMGSRFKVTPKKTDLYKYWGTHITEALKREAEQMDSGVILDLASKEYSKAARPERTGLRVIHVDFKEGNGDSYRMVSFFAKKARGMMARFAAEHQVTDVEQMKAFDTEGYLFRKEMSSDDRWVFTRG